MTLAQWSTSAQGRRFLRAVHDIKTVARQCPESRDVGEWEWLLDRAERNITAVLVELRNITPSVSAKRKG